MIQCIVFSTQTYTVELLLLITWCLLSTISPYKFSFCCIVYMPRQGNLVVRSCLLAKLNVVEPSVTSVLHVDSCTNMLLLLRACFMTYLTDTHHWSLSLSLDILKPNQTPSNYFTHHNHSHHHLAVKWLDNLTSSGLSHPKISACWLNGKRNCTDY